MALADILKTRRLRCNNFVSHGNVRWTADKYGRTTFGFAIQLEAIDAGQHLFEENTHLKPC